MSATPRRSIAAMYCGKLSQSHATPRISTSCGSASTLTRSHAIVDCWPGRQGATPTPQLPISSVVTPCQHEQVSSGSHEICRVVMRMDIDEAGREHRAAGVDFAPRRAARLADRGYFAVLHRERAVTRWRAPVPSQMMALQSAGRRPSRDSSDTCSKEDNHDDGGGARWIGWIAPHSQRSIAIAAHAAKLR